MPEDVEVSKRMGALKDEEKLEADGSITRRKLLATMGIAGAAVVAGRGAKFSFGSSVSNLNAVMDFDTQAFQVYSNLSN